jgi:hypothetical protein
MAEQAQGFTAGTSTPSLTGVATGGGGGVGSMPAIPEALTSFGEGLGTPGAVQPEQSWGEKVAGGIQKAAVPLMQMGTALMQGPQGRETVGSRVSGVLASTFANQKMNEALKKMVTSQLKSGGSMGVGGGGSFNEGQPEFGLTGADVAGLTAEQISKLYSTGVELREKEMKRPFENLQALSDSYLKIMSGEAKPAETEAHLMTAEKTRKEIEWMPVKNFQDWKTKEEALKKIKEETAEIIAKTQTEKEKPETARVEREKTKKETEKMTAGMDPTQVKAIEEAKLAGYDIKEAGDRLVVFNKSTGKEMWSVPKGAAPESATKKAAEELPMKKFAMQRIAPLVVRQLDTEMAALPGGKQKVDLQNLISSLRGYTGEIDPGVLLAKSSPELQDKFNKLMDIYVKTPGLSETEFGGIVTSILGTKTPVIPGKAGGEKKGGIIQKGTAEKSVQAEGLTMEQIAKVEEQAKKENRLNAVYESSTMKIEVRDGKVVNFTPKKSTVQRPYGTY